MSFFLPCFTILTLLVYSSVALLNFKMEQYSFLCPKQRPTITKFSKEDVVLKVTRNVVYITGVGNVSQVINKPIEVQVKAMKCESPVNCMDFYSMKITRMCDYLKNVPFTDYGYGDFFKPKILCPIQRGQYSINVNQTLEKLASMPIGSNLFKVQMDVYEAESASKKNFMFCFEGLIRTMKTSSRRN